MGLSRGRSSACQSHGSGAKLHSQAAEMKRGSGPLGSLSLPFHPSAHLCLALSAIKGQDHASLKRRRWRGKWIGSADRMIEGRSLIRMKAARGVAGGGRKRSHCLLPATGWCLIKNLPLVESEFQNCFQVNTRRRTSEASHDGQRSSRTHR